MANETSDLSYETRTGRFFRRTEANPFPFIPFGLLPLLGLIAIALYALIPFAQNVVEAETRRSVERAVAETGSDWVDYSVSGQIVSLTGSAPSESAVTKLEDAIRTYRSQTAFGLHRPSTFINTNILIPEVEEETVEASSETPEESEEQAPELAEPESVLAVPTNPEPESVLAVPTIPEPESVLAVPENPEQKLSDEEREALELEMANRVTRVFVPQPGFSATLEDGTLFLDGAVSDQRTRQVIGTSAGAIIDPPRIKSVENNLTVLDSDTPEGFRDTARHVVKAIGYCTSGEARFLDERFSLQCTLPEETISELETHLDKPLGFGQTDTVDILPYISCPDRFGTVLETSRLRFDSGSARLQSDSEKILQALAETTATCPGTLRIGGHTDNTGGVNLNNALSKVRAETVRQALVELGVNPDRLVVEGFGATRPIATNLTPEGRARNRRIEFTLIDPGEIEERD